jgi:hypothetical protein
MRYLMLRTALIVFLTVMRGANAALVVFATVRRC